MKFIKLAALTLCCGLLASCDNSDVDSEIINHITSQITTETTVEITTATEISTSETVTTESETSASQSGWTENSVVSGDFTYTVPSEKFIEKSLKTADFGSVYIVMTPDGECKAIPYNHYWAVMSVEELKRLADKEAYDLLSDDLKTGVKETYEGFREYMAGPLFTSENQRYVDSDYNMKIGPAVYFICHVHADSDEDADVIMARLKTLADYLFSKPIENPEIIDAMSASLADGNNYFCSVSYEGEGTTLTLDANYSSEYIKSWDENHFNFNEDVEIIKD
ncbi:MAG: hypothetical protein J6K17_07910 [Oscillospiraceae bacterium]|nr:hypothetical protein [Oscillospiraceae bacterium]